MPVKNICVSCGAILSPSVSGGQCPKCLFRLAWSAHPEETEVGSQKAEVRGQESEISGQKADVRDQKAEDRTPPDSSRRPLTSDLRPLISDPRPPTSDLCPLVFGDYELGSEIARGGMGVVYRARQISLNRAVALKMIARGEFASPALVQRFQIEAGAAARLDHPHIVPIYEIGEHRGQVYYSMKLVEGGNLAARISNRKSPISNRDAARLLLQIAEAIHYAHQRGVLHRDLKPSNVLIGADGSPRVADFGLAKVLEDESGLTLSTAALGTPAYMAPEQAGGQSRQVSTATDIYGLGAILYELLTGRPPFQAESALATMRKVVEEEPAPPWVARRRQWQQRQENPKSEARNPKEARSPKSEPAPGAAGLPASDFGFRPSDLDIICLKCLEKEPAKRYASAEQLAADLDRFLRDEPILARPASRAERAWRWCRRKPALAGALATAAILLLAVLIGLPIAAWRIDHERLRAEKERQRAEKNEFAARNSELITRQKAYASDMNLVQQSLVQNNLGRAQFLLDRQRPQSGQRDLRGWEWRYLWQHCQSDALFTLCQKSNSIFSLALSPDGKWLAMGEEDEGRLSIWDLEKREEIIRFPRDKGPVFAVFSPHERLLAFSSGPTRPTLNSQYRVQLWDGDTKRTVTELPLDGPCRGLAFSGDGQTLATLSAGPEGQLTLWKVPEGIRLARHPALQVRYDVGLPSAVAPDMSVAAYALWTDSIRVVDLRTGQERWRQKLSDDYVTALAISPDGQVLASGAGFAPSPIRLWDVASGNEIAALEGHRGMVFSLVFWPDGKTLASASSDQTIRLWTKDGLRPDGWKPLRTLVGHKLEVWCLALRPDNRTLLSGCKDGSVLVWDTVASPRLSSDVKLPANLLAWSFVTNSQSVLTCDRQGRVGQWQGSPLAEERLFDMGTNVSRAAFLPHRSMVLALLRNGTIQVWDLQTRSFSRELTLASGPLRRWLCKAQGKRLIIGDLGSETLHE